MGLNISTIIPPNTPLESFLSSASTFSTVPISIPDSAFSTSTYTPPPTNAIAEISSALATSTVDNISAALVSSPIANSSTLLAPSVVADSSTALAPSAIASSSTIPATSAAVNPSRSAAPLRTAAIINETSVLGADILIIARDSAQANIASSGLNAYGIPFKTLLVPQAGAPLPELDSPTEGGRFGGIVVAGEASYDLGNGTWASGLTPAQWNQLYAYQSKYHVRLVEYDVSPGAKFDTTPAAGTCCDDMEQLISLSDTSGFPSAGLRTGAAVSTKGLWHYPAVIANSSTTKAIATFGANQLFKNETVAAVINNFDGREQMAFFIAFDPTWSATSTYLQHAWITWITRGLYAGYRRVNLNTQIDDMFLSTLIYQSDRSFRITPTDLDGINAWLPGIRSKMNPGSTYFMEVGHNGNGNIATATEALGDDARCNGGALVLADPGPAPLEFKKPPGTGTNIWPDTPATFDWDESCLEGDVLLPWWQKNYNEYAHVSHTFTHLRQDNVTYSDASKEITFNQDWLSQVGLASATRFTSNGIIPSAITGLHNGDALQAWDDRGITNCVGDNSRAVLRNQQNPMWPYFTSLASDGFAGMQVNPRWPTRIYFDCDSPECAVRQWVYRSAGNTDADFNDLLAAERETTLVYLLGLYHDSYMFHQANLRNADAAVITLGSLTGRYSIFQAWIETIVQELVRLVTWPIVSTTQQQMSDNFLQRYNRDQCRYALGYEISGGYITGFRVTAEDDECEAKIPVTSPVGVLNTQNFTTEQLGSDPLTVWVQLSGGPVSLALASPIAL
ncbi:extracellular serine-rich protein [Aspergillus insuetus]